MHLKKGLLIILILTLFLSGCASIGSREASDFKLPNLEGKEVSLADYTGDKPIIIKFWSLGCSTCIETMPELQEVYEENRDKVEVVTISISPSQTEVKRLMEQEGYTFPVLFDRSGEVAEEYLVNGVPKMVFINSEGMIAFEYSGAWSKEEMENLIEKG